MWCYYSTISLLIPSLPVHVGVHSVLFSPPNCRRRAAPGDRLSMHYVGSLLAGGRQVSV